jgi:glucosamine--fructose-6-phosphate aminotransferase (isomerizing)
MTNSKTSKHPYAMYTAIHSQADEISNVVRKSFAETDRLADYVSRCGQVALIGIGSSLHAAQLAGALWREQLPKNRVSAEHAFDFATGYSPLCLEELSSEAQGASESQSMVVVLSHRGSKRYSRQALVQARKSGSTTCLITGEGVEVSPEDADLHITTVPQERSSAHTVSLVGALAVLVGVIERLRLLSNGELVGRLREAVLSGYEAEGAVSSYVKSVSPDTRHIWIVGAGSDVITAKEIALKIKETSYIPAEGLSVEEMLHGPFQCVQPQDLLIAIDMQSIGSERIRSLLQMADVIGMPTFTLGVSRPQGAESSPSFLALSPSASRTMNSVSALVALQLFTYFLALERGRDPDSFRLEDPSFKQAALLTAL